MTNNSGRQFTTVIHRNLQDEKAQKLRGETAKLVWELSPLLFVEKVPVCAADTMKRMLPWVVKLQQSAESVQISSGSSKAVVKRATNE